jgi:hypothetical protein
MSRMSHRYSNVFGVLLLGLITACVGMGGYGRLYAPWPSAASPRVEDLVAQWEDYDVYYAHYSDASVGTATAVLFHPKKDNRRLVADKWVTVTEKGVLVRLIEWLKADLQFPPTLYEVRGPDDQVYGYMFTAVSHVVIKKLDDQTLWIDDIPLPPIDYGAGRPGT